MKRRCIFCGRPFLGQVINFEHVIPEWLVEEADLSKRSAPVNLFGRKFDAALNRIGAKVCKSCNDERASLEGAAKAAYVKVRDGVALTDADARTLLDWLDKIRVGMWLWTNAAAPVEAKIEPKFYINQRLAIADRIAVIARYPEDLIGRGLMFHGLDPAFLWAPSVFGFLANNIAFFSFSSDFLLARHIRDLKILRTLRDDDHQDVDVNAADRPGARLFMLGNPYMIGQCIFAEDIFNDHNIAFDSLNSRTSLGESKVMRLTPSLTDAETEFGIVPYTNLNPRSHFTLQELNATRIFKFLLEDYLRTDFSKLSNPKHRQSAVSTAHFFVHAKAMEGKELVREYERATSIKLFGL